MAHRPEIYLATILLEPNRWAAGKSPTIRVSEWLDRIRRAGFDGIELWENHYLRRDRAERDAVGAGVVPVAVFNTYATFDEAGAAAREAAASAINALRPNAVKFNVGKDASRLDEELQAVLDWAGGLPAGTRLWCECHPGTMLETPPAAAAAFERWSDPRFGAIVHAFNPRGGSLADWIDALGSRLAHVHVQARGATGGFARLDQQPTEATRALRLLRERGFRGSFSVEFTAGTKTADDEPETLFANALSDLAFLRNNG